MGERSAWDVARSRVLMGEKSEVTRVEFEMLNRMALGLVAEMVGDFGEALFSYLAAVALSVTASQMGVDTSAVGSPEQLAVMEVYLVDRCQQLRLLLDEYPEQLAAFECRIEAVPDMLEVYSVAMTYPAAQEIASLRVA